MKVAKPPRRSKQRRETQPQTQGHPAIMSRGSGVPELPAPEGMSQDELAYRMLLQEALFFVTREVLAERKEEITKRAEVRARTLMELRE